MRDKHTHDMQGHDMHGRGNQRSERGAALVAAVALLAIFSMLGVAYLRSMSIEEDRVRWENRGLRAETLADDYLRIAIQDLNAMIANGDAVPGELTFPTVPVYVNGRDGAESLVDTESLRGEIRIRIRDEASKLDLNRASAALIGAVTGLDEAAATRIRENTRSPFRPDAGGNLPLSTLDELKTRGLLDEAAFDALPREHITVFSGPGPLLNANAMPEAMLASVLGVDADTAAALAAARPFASREALEAQLGDDATLPAAVGVSSNCYRLLCEVVMTQPTAGQAWQPARTQRLEAVVAFGGDGPRVLHWQRAPVPDNEESTS